MIGGRKGTWTTKFSQARGPEPIRADRRCVGETPEEEGMGGEQEQVGSNVSLQQRIFAFHWGGYWLGNSGCWATGTRAEEARPARDDCATVSPVLAPVFLSPTQPFRDGQLTFGGQKPIYGPRKVTFLHPPAVRQ